MIKFSDLTFAYTPGAPFFANTSLTLGGGGVVALIGANGSGKTTLIRIIAGLLSPSGGTISVVGYTPSRRAKGFLQAVFYLPEEFSLPRTTAARFSSIYARFYPNYSAGQFVHLLHKFNISPNDPLEKMSFGSRKKVFLAFALACNTSILLLDEPTNGLDPVSSRALLSILASCASPERTIIIATHHISTLDTIFSRVVILDDGRVCLNATYSALGEQLIFGDNIDESQAIYSEVSLNGTRAVALNHAARETPIQLDILYKAVCHDKELFSNMFHEKIKKQL
ncbi:MAG: ABC transporter ATP-binding protein [Mucinivorans sp.]